MSPEEVSHHQHLNSARYFLFQNISPQNQHVHVAFVASQELCLWCPNSLIPEPSTPQRRKVKQTEAPLFPVAQAGFLMIFNVERLEGARAAPCPAEVPAWEPKCSNAEQLRAALAMHQAEFNCFAPYFTTRLSPDFAALSHASLFFCIFLSSNQCL